MKKNGWLLLAILVGGAVLRSINLQTRGIQYDDAFSILLAQRSLPDIILGTAADTMPPLYYFILHFWLLISNNVWFIRLLSLLFSEGTILFAFLVSKKLADEQTALAASFLVAISPLQIYHAQDIRMYALLVFCQSAYLYFFVKEFLGDKDKGIGWINLIGMFVFGTAAMYSHNLAIFGLMIPNLYLLIKKEWKSLVRLFEVQVGIGLAFLPWLLFLPGQLSKIQNAFWTPKPGLVEIFQAMIMFHANLPLPGIWLAVAAVISVEILVLVGMGVWRKRKTLAKTQFLIYLTLFPPILLFLISYLMRPVFVPRGFLISEVGYACLAGWVISHDFRKDPGILILGLFVAAAVVCLPYQQTYNQFPRSPFQQASVFIEKNLPKDGIVIHDNKLSFFPMEYFSPQVPQKYLADPAGSQNDTLAKGTQSALGLPASPDLATATKSGSPVFFVIFQETLQEYNQQTQDIYPPLGWLQEHFNLSKIYDIGDIRIYSFLP